MIKIDELIVKLDYFAVGFLNDWNQEDGLYNEGQDTNVHSLFSYFSHYVADRLDDSSSIRKKELFKFIEEMMTYGTKTQKDAIATCFLESLLHVVGVKFEANNYFPYLGKESIEFLRAYDIFNGVKTDGLWY